MTAVFASTSIRCLVKGLASEPWMYYMGAMMDLLGSYAMSIVMSMISCCVPADDLGKVMAGKTFIECIVPLGIVQLYASVWKVSQYLIHYGYPLTFMLENIASFWFGFPGIRWGMKLSEKLKKLNDVKGLL